MGELIVNGIKWAFIIGVSLTFMTAINALINLIASITTFSVIGEVLGIFSNCLPFSASAVMGAITTVLNAVLSFMIAKKIYDLTSAKIQI